MSSTAPPPRAFGRLLRDLRRRAGLSQEQLAHTAGVSVRALADLERGRTRGPQRRTVEALVSALALAPDEAHALEAAAAPGRLRASADPAGGSAPPHGGGATGAAGPSTAADATTPGGPGPGPEGGPSAVGGTSLALGTGPEGGPNTAGDTGTAGGAERPASSTHAALALSLPRDTRDFTAREQALDEACALVDRAEAGHPPVLVVTGQPGLGKTAFGVRLAHTLAPRFTDGQLFVNLRGMDAEPTDPREVLATLLRALEVAEHAIPHDLAGRSGLLRSLLAPRRLLLVLDNAAHEAQIRPLLPSLGGSLTVITSRSGLTGLEGVHRIALPLLRREESVELLTRVVGPARVGREAQAARDLTDLCGHLPLAIRIVGQRLAGRPRERLAKLVAQLAREERRLDLLNAGDLRVRAAFGLSYEQLSPASQTLLRRSALASGPDVSPETAALLAGVSLPEAELGLDELADRGLLQADAVAERYRFHDLLRLFAAELVASEDGPGTERAARDRTARWMLARATAAGLHFDARRSAPPDETTDVHGGPGADPGEPTTGDPDPATAPATRAEARRWLEAEWAQWLAALRHAAEAGWHRAVVDAAEAMHWFSDLTQHWELWVEVFRRAAEAARALGSGREEATHLNYLAWAYNLCVYDHRAALAAARAAYVAARDSGDQLQTGWALGYEAGALRRLGRLDEAVAGLREAAACHQRNATPEGRIAELTTLNVLGEVLREQGQAQQALDIHLRGAEICRAGIPGLCPDLLALYQAATAQHVGNDHAALGQWQHAEGPLRSALAAFESSDMPAWSGPAHLELGIVLRHVGRLAEARTAVRAALATLTEHRSPRQAEARAELRVLDALLPS
ncbi:ATP-binding protein [Streptomyces buecherae]|uniref:ATP-binding protein n=1 Tax=Streptomyces buecherae TaxID=2763006 RepID=UPI0027E0C24C|nr:helix-turn-helix domain-containing protein [Streptomyces buecherae]